MPNKYPVYSCSPNENIQEVVFDKVVLLNGTETELDTKNNGIDPMDVGEVAINTTKKEINHLFGTGDLRRIPFPAPTECRNATAVDFQMGRACDAQSASGSYSVISGGADNTASGNITTVSGGAGNIASGYFSTVGGGACNTSSAYAFGNIINAFGPSTVSGGYCNTASGNASNVAGGVFNTVSGRYSNINGGACNRIPTSYWSVIGGGNSNCIVNGDNSVVSGGSTNTSCGGSNVISGGRFNCACAFGATILGGCCNANLGRLSNIIGGVNNRNTSAGSCASIVGGCNNTINSPFSFIAGGSANDTRGFANTFILGTALSATQTNYTYVNNLSSQGVVAANGGDSNNWNSGFNAGTIFSQNSASYANSSFVNSNFFPLSGGTITGATRINNNLTVFGDLSATGNSYFANTIYSTTSALSVINLGNTGPALYVGNNGTGDIASFYDIDQGIEVLHVGGNNGSFPNVGIKTSTPNVDFTVNGQISANNTIWSANGNSNNWNNAFNVATTYQNASGNWQSTFETVSSLSANWILDGGNIKGSNLLIGTNDAFDVNLESNNIVRMTIASSGNIGIGTTTPNANLTVNGTLSTTGQSSFTNIDETQIFPIIVSNTLNLVLSSSTFFVVNLNNNITTMNFLNPPANQRAYSFILQLSADGTSRAVTWPTSVKWPSGTIPTLTTTVNKVDTFTFITYDSGINYFGFVSGQNS